MFYLHFMNKGTKTLVLGKVLHFGLQLIWFAVNWPQIADYRDSTCK